MSEEPYETYCSCGLPLRRIGGHDLWDAVARKAIQTGAFDRERAIRCPLCRQSAYGGYVVPDLVLAESESNE